MTKMIIHLKSGNVVEITKEKHGIIVENAYHYSILNGKSIVSGNIFIPFRNIDYVEMVEE